MDINSTDKVKLEMPGIKKEDIVITAYEGSVQVYSK